jgi:hypothetical protein
MAARVIASRRAGTGNQLKPPRPRCTERHIAGTRYDDGRTGQPGWRQAGASFEPSCEIWVPLLSQRFRLAA